MKLVVISPESDEPREHTVLAGLFAAGLERYHVRKPHWSREKLAAWLDAVPGEWRSRLVLHQYHDLVAVFGCGGMHFKDSAGRVLGAPKFSDGMAVRPCFFSSRSCHDIETLNASMGNFDALFLSPVFPSISKLGYRPRMDIRAVSELLARRTDEERTTEVIALGGITPENAARCGELGFDGIAILGAVWCAEEPLEIFDALQQSITNHAT